MAMTTCVVKMKLAFMIYNVSSRMFVALATVESLHCLVILLVRSGGLAFHVCKNLPPSRLYVCEFMLPRRAVVEKGIYMTLKD